MPTTTTTQTKTQKAVRHCEGCPACSHKLAYPVPGTTQLYRCAACDGIYGSCYLGDSYTHVLPYMTEEPNVPQERMRYYDFTCVGSKGITRRHGWYDTATKLIVQVG